MITGKVLGISQTVDMFSDVVWQKGVLFIKTDALYHKTVVLVIG